MAHLRLTSNRLLLATLLILLACAKPSRAQDEAPSPRQIFSQAVAKWANLIEGREGASQTLTAQLKFVKTDGLPHEAAGATIDLAFQAPDHLRISGSASGVSVAVGRDGQVLWVHEPSLKFAVLGKAGVPRFLAEPDRLDATVLPPFKLPVSRMQMSMMSLMLDIQQSPDESINGQPCDVLRIGLLPQATELLGITGGQATLWLRKADRFPLRVTNNDANHADVQVDVVDLKLSDPWTAEQWQLRANPGDDVQTVALGHLTRFLEVGPKLLPEKAQPLGAISGEREVVASEGAGRLEMIDGTRVLFLKGSAEEMGRQQGALLKKQVRQLCDHVLYGVGVGSSFLRGKWFFGEIERAEGRLHPFMDPRYLSEMDAIADASGMDRQEARLANFFPELFHCSGFSLYGKATGDGHMYHGRVLDYLRGIGLEQNAVVMVYQPDYGNAWVNLGYAGFIGSVTAMNEKGISIGEMGGAGYGDWDGKPMAELMREVMEKSNSLDDAVRIMRTGPRTCHYYYVISDGKTQQAVGIDATPTTFRVLPAGAAAPELPHAFDDSVLMSAGNRYEELCNRVKSNYGSFDARSARDLMTRPVCMNSNIQSVLFEPDTLDFWVANADSEHVASAARYTHYNLRALLKSPPPKSESFFHF
jgi:isopenicillin-N N-acyltransferase-like protein